MIVIGLLFVAVAAAAAVVLIVQNRADMINLHALGQTWSMHLYWLLVIGLIIAAVALLGFASLRAGGRHAQHLRMERKSLRVENKQLSKQLRVEREQPATVVGQPATVVEQPATVVEQPAAVVERPADAEVVAGRDDERHGLFAHRPFHRTV